MSSIDGPSEGSWTPDPNESWRGSAADSGAPLEIQLPRWFSVERFSESDVAARLHAALRDNTIPIGSVTNEANDWADRLSMPKGRFEERDLFEFLERPHGLTPEARFCVARAINIDPSSLIEYDEDYFRSSPTKSLEQALFYPIRLRRFEFVLGATVTIGSYSMLTKGAAQFGYGDSAVLTVLAVAGAASAGIVMVSLAGRWINFVLPSSRRPPLS